jgi:hypothetical protein
VDHGNRGSLLVNGVQNSRPAGKTRSLGLDLSKWMQASLESRPGATLEPNAPRLDDHGREKEPAKGWSRPGQGVGEPWEQAPAASGGRLRGEREGTTCQVWLLNQVRQLRTMGINGDLDGGQIHHWN